MDKKYTYFIVIFLIAASLLAYGRILGNDFINLDDNAYITENDHIKSGINPASIKWALTTTYFSYWHPLTWLSHMLDWGLFGSNASGHHMVSLLLHISAVIFLFLFLNKTTKNIWPSAFAAAIFALHPLRVESVAWGAERKDVLSMFFAMACFYSYAFYAESSKLSKYLLCLIIFALALMSKPMMVSLPFVLMLFDYWPLKRWPESLHEQGRGLNSIGGLIREKVPFLFLTIVASILTVWAQSKSGIVVPMESLSFPVRFTNAIISYVSYLGKMFWPVNLAVFYPYDFSFPLGEVFISGIILTLITLAALYYIRKFPYLFVGWFCYLGTLIPVIGLVQVGMQAMADRYTYLPSAGIAIGLAWGIESLIKNENIRRNILFPTGFAVIIILSVLTWKQCGYWKNSFDLFNHALQVTKNNYTVHNNLAFTLFSKGRVEDAIDHYNKAIQIAPYYADAYYNRATLYNAQGNHQRAIEDINKAIGLKKDFADAYNNRGNLYIKLGQYQCAIDDYNEAIRIKQDDAEAYYNRGIAYHNLGKYQRAIEDYNTAIAINPSDGEIYNNRGAAYTGQGSYGRALEDFNKAVILKQNYTDAISNRANVYFVQNNNLSGCRESRKACELGNCKTWEAAKAKKICN